MRIVFADTGYWIAMANPDDGLHASAKFVTEQLGDIEIVTSEMVLVEFLNFMGRHGEYKRRLASNAVEQILKDPDVEVVLQTSDLFRAAVELYASRLDQRWSVTDCASFLLMDQRGISEALARDRDFTQAGFVALL